MENGFANISSHAGADIITLRELYYFVLEKDKRGEGLKGTSPAGKLFGKIATEVVKDIPEKQGFYLWGTYDRNKLWRNIYLGKAGKGKTASLKARILEELKDERGIFWRSHFTKEQILNMGESNYSNMWKKYRNHWERAIKKEGSTHILWVHLPDINNVDVEKIESDLIETLNPIANIKRPSPHSDLQDKTTEIIRRFKSLIHSNRKESYNVKFI